MFLTRLLSLTEVSVFFSPLNSLAGLFSFQVYLTLPSAKTSSSYGDEFAFIMIS